jgi:hypothetical protein
LDAIRDDGIIFDSFSLGGDWGKFMPDTADLLEADRETPSDLRRLVLEEINGDAVLDDATVDALVRGIASLLQRSSLPSSD